MLEEEEITSCQAVAILLKLSFFIMLNKLGEKEETNM